MQNWNDNINKILDLDGLLSKVNADELKKELINISLSYVTLLKPIIPIDYVYPIDYNHSYAKEKKVK